MKRSLIILLAFILLVGTVLAQAPDTIWTNTYGGADIETFECAAALSDDCYVLGGYGRSFGYPDDAYLVKIDQNGDTLWTRLYGGSYFDYLNGIVETVDGNIAVAGRHSAASGAIRKAWLFKLDNAGDLMWEKEYTGAVDLETRAIANTADSGFILTGYMSTGTAGYDFWLLKTDSVGDSLWFTTIGGDGNDQPTKILQTSDDGYIIVGTTRSFDPGDDLIWIVRTDAAGDTLWTDTSGTLGYNDLNPSLVETGPDTYLMATSSYDAGSGLYAAHLMEFVAAPEAISILYEGHTLLDRSVSINSVYRCPDGGTLIAGNAGGYPYPLGNQAILAKLDASFDTVWTTHIGGDGTDRANFVHEASNRQIFIAGQWYAATTSAQYYAVRYQPSILDVDDDHTGDFLPDGFVLDQNYPNPFNPGTKIAFALPRASDVRLDVYNLLGQKVATLIDRVMSPGEYTMEWDGHDVDGNEMAGGVYFYRLKAGDWTASRKMILLK